MDVSLILTHRCNFSCGYCYAGEHHKTDIDDRVLRRAVDLLYSDGVDRAQLSFFGGEPFLAFDAMRRATALAEGRAEEKGKRLILQCTSNGSLIREEQLAFILEHDMRVTVSIDGVREAHDQNRPCAGGKPSFDVVHAGLRTLIDAGAPVDALMVITPQTASYAYLSANFLWTEGVKTVRANLALNESWTAEQRAELREQLVSIGWELLARRMRGEDVRFQPFDAGMREFHQRAEPPRRSAEPARAKVVVGTTGNLYPCGPMVGEDRDDGPEAELRLGHIDMDPAAIKAAVTTDGVACEKGKGCQCAAYLETGSRYTAGAMGRWYGTVCREVGATIAESLARHELTAPRAPRRRRFMVGLAAIVGGAAIGAPLLSGLLAEDDLPRPCRLRTRKSVVPYPEDLQPPGAVAVPVDIPPPGGLSAPEFIPPPEPEAMIDGELAIPEPLIEGDMMEPE